MKKYTLERMEKHNCYWLAWIDDNGALVEKVADFYNETDGKYCSDRLNRREQLKEISRLGQEAQPEAYDIKDLVSDVKAAANKAAKVITGENIEFGAKVFAGGQENKTVICDVCGKETKEYQFISNEQISGVYICKEETGCNAGYHQYELPFEWEDE